MRSRLPQVPKSLIFMDTDFKSGVQLGTKMVGRMKSLGMSLEGRFLDFGCGWGRVAYGLSESGFGGEYDGVDILQNRIEWLRANVTPQSENMRFHLSDSSNARYKKEGSPEKFKLNRVTLDRRYENIFLGSVFTHMWQDDIDHYMSELSDVLTDDGTLVFTCFMIDPPAQQFLSKGRGKFRMPIVHNEVCRYESEDDPLYAISYSRDYFEGLLDRNGLTVIGIMHGTWSGRPGLAGHDWVAVRKSVS